MRISSFSFLASAALATANLAVVDDYTSPLPFSDRIATTRDAPNAVVPSQKTRTATEPLATLETLSQQEYDRLPDALKQFIIDSSPKQHVLGRQNIAIGGGAAPATPTPTQLSPIVTFDAGAGQQTYTITFPTVNSQLPLPAAGTIGLGNIQGKVGQLRTYNAAPTAHVDSRVVMAIIGGVGAGMIL